MVKLITFGDYNPKYKYIFFYILIRLPFEYFFGDAFPEEMKLDLFTYQNMPGAILVYDIFKYIGIFIFGYVAFKFEFKSRLEMFEKIEKFEGNDISSEVALKYKSSKNPRFSLVSFLILISIYVINNKLIGFYYTFGLTGLDFWTLQLIFICFLNILLFKIKIYIHQKISIAIILIFSTLMKIFSIVSICISPDDKVYKEYIWLLFFGVIVFLLSYVIDSYALCTMKWYLDLKFISTSKLMICFGILGIIFSFLGSFISNFIECKDDAFSFHVCFMYDESGTKKYFDNFAVFFKQIWKKGRDASINVGYIFIILLKVALTALYHFLSFLIIQFFSPEVFVCADSILYFITKLISLVYYIVTDSLKYDFIFDGLSQVFSILGTVIYLELIELNFCGLNFNLKKNIESRANIEALGLEFDDVQSIGGDYVL